MKIAIGGKGGVGKTLLAALLAQTSVESGYSVLVIDADADANLAATLGFIPHDHTLVDADLASLPLFDSSQQITNEVRNIYKALLSSAQAPGKIE